MAAGTGVNGVDAAGVATAELCTLVGVAHGSPTSRFFLDWAGGLPRVEVVLRRVPEVLMGTGLPRPDAGVSCAFPLEPRLLVLLVDFGLFWATSSPFFVVPFSSLLLLFFD